MIPFIIGGVALAATGYGVAKLLDDDCSCDKNSNSYFVDLEYENCESQEYEFIKKFELAKVELYNTSFMELKVALSEIENLDKEILITTAELEKRIYLFKELSNEIKQSFEQFTHILYSTKKYINSKLDFLDLIIVNESNYEKYSEENKQLVDELFQLFRLINKVSKSEITNDNLSISRKMKRGFIKMKQIIN